MTNPAFLPAGTDRSCDASRHASLAYGVLTLATPNDYLKAIGLCLSLRVSNPGLPVAVACSEKVATIVAPYFDHVILEERGLKGFVHKVYLDRYSPFEETLFLDSDVLIFKPVKPYTDRWGPACYSACGYYVSDGYSGFGLDRVRVLNRLGKDRLVVIDGAGHGFFRKPDCYAMFDEARQVSADYRDWGAGIPYADEDVVDIVMTKMDLPPIDGGDFFARYLSARRGTMKMDASRGICHFIDVTSGMRKDPCMIHFAANEAAIPYTYQLLKIFRKFGVPTKGLVQLGLEDFYERDIKLWLLVRRDAFKRKLKTLVMRTG